MRFAHGDTGVTSMTDVATVVAMKQPAGWRIDASPRQFIGIAVRRNDESSVTCESLFRR